MCITFLLSVFAFSSVCGELSALPDQGFNDSAERQRIVFPDGSVYNGQLKNGEIEGQGTLSFSDGSIYTGSFQNGEMNGQGTMIFPDGTTYVGELKDGMLFGKGVLTFPDGSRYEGSFENNKYHGRGKWFSHLGLRYEGRFRYGKFHGRGVCSLPDGSSYTGFFEEDQFREAGTGAHQSEATLQREGDLNAENEQHSGSTNVPCSHETVGHPLSVTDPPVRAGCRTGKAAVSVPTFTIIRKVSSQKVKCPVEKDRPSEPAGLAKLQEENRAPVGSMESADPAVSVAAFPFAVQIGAFLSKTNAETRDLVLKTKGYNARVVPLADKKGVIWYSVRLGKIYSSLEEAQETASALSEKEKMPAIVRPSDSL